MHYLALTPARGAVSGPLWNPLCKNKCWSVLLCTLFHSQKLNGNATYIHGQHNSCRVPESKRSAGTKALLGSLNCLKNLLAIRSKVKICYSNTFLQYRLVLPMPNNLWFLKGFEDTAFQSWCMFRGDQVSNLGYLGHTTFVVPGLSPGHQELCRTLTCSPFEVF